MTTEALATKANLKTLGDDLRGEIQEVREDLQELRGEVKKLKGDVKELKGDVQQLKGDVRGIRAEMVTKTEMHAAMQAMEFRLSAQLAHAVNVVSEQIGK